MGKLVIRPIRAFDREDRRRERSCGSVPDRDEMERRVSRKRGLQNRTLSARRIHPHAGLPRAMMPVPCTAVSVYSLSAGIQ